MAGLGDVWNLIVKISGDGSKFRDDIKEDIATLDELFASLHDTAVSINLDDTDAEAKLEAFKAQLDALRDATEAIHLDDGVAKDELDAFKAKLDALRDQVVDLKVDDLDAKEKIEAIKTDIASIDDAKVDVNIDNTGVETQVEETNLQLDGIANEKDVKVNIDNTGVAIQAAEVDAEIDAEIPDEKIVYVDVQQAPGNGAANNARRGAGILPWLIGGAVPLLPSVGAPLVAGGMGLLSSLLAGGAGTAGLAAVATPDIKGLITDQQNLKTAVDAVSAAEAKVKGATTYQQWLTATQGLTTAQNALKTAQDGVGASEQRAISALTSFESFWKSFTDSFKPAVFGMMTQGLDMLQTLLTEMKPVISAAASAFTQLLSEASKALGSPFWKSFFQFLSGAAKDSIMSMGTSLGNLTKGLAGLMMAFEPMAKSMNQGLVNLTQRFADWASHLSATKGFQQFLQYAEENGPKVSAVLGDAFRIIGQLLTLLAPVGSAFLSLLDAVLKFISGLLQSNSVIGDLIRIILAVVTDVMQFVTWVINLLNWLQKTHPVIMQIIEALALLVTALLVPISPIILIITGIAGLIAAGVELVKHWGDVKAKAEEIWGAIQTFFTKLWNDLKAFFGKWGVDILAVLAPFIGVPLLIEKNWGTISKWFRDLWTIIKTDASKLWGDITSTLSGLAKGAYKAITDVFDGLGTYFSNLWTEAITWGENLVGNIAKGIENAISSVKNAIGNVVNAIAGPLAHHSPAAEGPLSDDDQWMPRMMQMMIGGVQEYTPKLASAINGALSVVAVPSNVSAMMQQAGQRFAQSAATGLQSIHAPVTVQINAPVYGVDDLQSAINEGWNQNMSGFMNNLKQTAWATGVGR